MESVYGIFSEVPLKEDRANLYFGSAFFTIFFVKKTSHFQGHTSAASKLKLIFFSEMAIKQLYNYFLQERTIHPEKKFSYKDSNCMIINVYKFIYIYIILYLYTFYNNVYICIMQPILN